MEKFALKSHMNPINYAYTYNYNCFMIPTKEYKQAHPFQLKHNIQWEYKEHELLPLALFGEKLGWLNGEKRLSGDNGW